MGWAPKKPLWLEWLFSSDSLARNSSNRHPGTRVFSVQTLGWFAEALRGFFLLCGLGWSLLDSVLLLNIETPFKTYWHFYSAESFATGTGLYVDCIEYFDSSDSVGKSFVPRSAVFWVDSNLEVFNGVLQPGMCANWDCQRVFEWERDRECEREPEIREIPPGTSRAQWRYALRI